MWQFEREILNVQVFRHDISYCYTQDSHENLHTVENVIVCKMIKFPNDIYSIAIKPNLTAEIPFLYGFLLTKHSPASRNGNAFHRDFNFKHNCTFGSFAVIFYATYKGYYQRIYSPILQMRPSWVSRNISNGIHAQRTRDGLENSQISAKGIIIIVNTIIWIILKYMKWVGKRSRLYKMLEPFELMTPHLPFTGSQHIWTNL